MHTAKNQAQEISYVAYPDGFFFPQREDKVSALGEG